MDTKTRTIEDDPGEYPKNILKAAFRALTDSCLEILQHHLDEDTPILCGVDVALHGNRQFCMSGYYDVAVLAVATKSCLMDTTLDTGLHWDTYAAYRVMMNATFNKYDQAVAHATPSEVRESILVVLQERGLLPLSREESHGNQDQEEGASEEARQEEGI